MPHGRPSGGMRKVDLKAIEAIRRLLNRIPTSVRSACTLR